MVEVQGLVGVYNARGGVRGELGYALGRLLGTAHCGLCDITHATVRRKPAWDRMAARLGVPVTLVHLDEVPDEVAPVVEAAGTPVVLARVPGGEPVVLLGPDDLELGGSVVAFEESLRDAVRRYDLRLPAR